MGFGDKFGAGFGGRFGASLGGDDDTVRSLAGDSYRVQFRGNAFVEGGAGAPDVVTATNIQGNSTSNVTQATESKQPHSGNVLGFPAFTFDKSALKYLANTASSPVLNDVADEVTLLLAFKLNATAGTEFLFEIGTGGTAQSGAFIFLTATLVVAKANTVGSGAVQATAAFTDTAAMHVVRCTLDSSGVAVGLDGTETLNAGSYGGMANDCEDISLGAGISGGGNPSESSIAEAVVLVNPTAQQKSDVENFLIDKYGV